MSSPINPNAEEATESITITRLKKRRAEIDKDRADIADRAEGERAELEHLESVLNALDKEAAELDEILNPQPAGPVTPLPFAPVDFLNVPLIQHACLACGTSWNADVLRCPQCWVPEPDSDGALSLEGAIAQAVGAASVCWTDDGVFEDQQARRVVDGLLRWIVDRFEAKQSGNPPSEQEGAYSPNSLLRAALQENGFDPAYADQLSRAMFRGDRIGPDLLEILTLGLIAQQREQEPSCVVFRVGKEAKLIPVSTQVPCEEALEIWRRVSEGFPSKTYHVVDFLA